MLLEESQRVVLEVMLMDSWKNMKRGCTTALETGEITGLKI